MITYLLLSSLTRPSSPVGCRRCGCMDKGLPLLPVFWHVLLPVAYHFLFAVNPLWCCQSTFYLSPSTSCTRYQCFQCFCWFTGYSCDVLPSCQFWAFYSRVRTRTRGTRQTDRQTDRQTPHRLSFYNAPLLLGRGIIMNNHESGWHLSGHVVVNTGASNARSEDRVLVGAYFADTLLSLPLSVSFLHFMLHLSNALVASASASDSFR